MSTLSSDGAKASRKAHIAFQTDIAPYRKDLYRFCRSLTGNPWDAEDLVQETLLKVFGRMADKHAGIDNAKSYLFRTAANQWIDWCRRAKLPLESAMIPDKPYTMGPLVEVRGALAVTLQYLPPKERVALVLKDIFDFTLEEVAEVSQSTTNAVKAALHRARTKMATLEGRSTAEERTFASTHRDLIEKAVVAFNARDLNAMSSLFLQSATGNAPGCFLESNLDEIKKGSLFYTINLPNGTPQPASFRAECRVIAGEPLFLIWNDDTLDDVWRFAVEDGQLAGFLCYYTCPDVLAEVAGLLGVEWNSHGYYYEAGAPH